MRITRLRKLCAAISEVTTPHRTVTILDANKRFFFKPCLVAAYAKSVEFNLYVQKLRRREHSFFLLGTLRSMCEDYIALKFLLSLPEREREECAVWLFGQAMGQSVKAQGEYFARHRPYQMVVSQPTDQLTQFLANAEKKLRESHVSSKWTGRTPFPSTKYMAKAVGELAMYDYLFHGTSCLVHFNPRVLMEMGWGPLPGTMTFSTQNFHRYYFQFCLVYAASLLAKSTLTFKSSLDLPASSVDLAVELQSELERPGRWPELVTFEAMNLRPTHMDHLRHLAIVMAREDARNSPAAESDA